MLYLLITALLILVFCAYKHAQGPDTISDLEAEYQNYLEDFYDF